MHLIILKYSVLIIIIAIYTSCGYQPSLPDNFDPDGKIVYIEDLSGKRGLGMPNFGDLVIIDPYTKEKYILTKDGFVNYHPTWNNEGTKILFESKRSRGNRTYSLSDPSNLFFYDLNDYRITQIDINWLKRIQYPFNYVNNTNPSFSNDGNKIAFSRRNRSLTEDIFIYELSSDSLYLFANDIHMLRQIKWSFDDSYLCVSNWWLDSLIQPRGETAITIYDIETGDTLVFLGNEDWSYRLGYYKDNKLVYLAYNFEERTNYIYARYK